MKNSMQEQRANGLNEEGKPTASRIQNFDRGWKRMADDTQDRYLNKLAPQLDEIRKMFIDGDRAGLLRWLTKTAPVRYKENEDMSLGEAQILNDMANIALCHLNGQLDSQGTIRPLTYQYQTSLHQSSADVDLVRAHTAAGLVGTKADQQVALGEIAARNPADAEVYARQETALGEMRKILGIEEK